MAEAVERKHPHTWYYCTMANLPKYEALGYRAIAHYKMHEEFESLMVGWFGDGPAPRVRLDD